MESLARDTILSNSVSKIQGVFDQYLDFVALEHQLFSLNLRNTFHLYNSSSGGDAAIEAAMHSHAQHLFTVFATLRQVPIIRAAAGGPAQMVAQLVHDLIQAHLRSASGGALFSDGGIESYARPLLVLYDRSLDLCAPLVHASSYQGVVADLLPYRLNRATVEGEGGRSYDLDEARDAFWRLQKGRSFPDAIEANSESLSEVRRREEELRAGGGGGSELSRMVEELPRVMEKKRLLENHTNVMKALMEEVTRRGVPRFMDLEGEVHKTPAADLLAFLSREADAHAHDKLRIAAVWVAANAAAPREDFEAVRDHVADVFRGASAAEIGAIDADGAAKLLAWLRRTMSLGGAAEDGESHSLIGSLVARGKQILGSDSKCKATKLCEAAAAGAQGFVHLDPKLRAVTAQHAAAPHDGKVVAFCIGPGTYMEYQNLVDTFGQKVTYGCSEITSPVEFLQQLQSLGKEM